LEEINELLDFTMNQIPEIVVGLDPNHSLVYCNKGAEFAFKRGVILFYNNSYE